MNTRINEARLDALAVKIAQLDQAAGAADHEAREAERTARELGGDELECVAKASRALGIKSELERTLRAYFIENEFIRRSEAERFAA